MDIKSVSNALSELVARDERDEFIYGFLDAFGIARTTITRLRTGNLNQSKVPGELLYRSRLFYTSSESQDLLATLDSLAKERRILRHKPRFLIVCNGHSLAAIDTQTGSNRHLSLEQLPQEALFFMPLIGTEVYRASNDNEADRNASYRLAELYEHLVKDNAELYALDSHSLNVLLSRLLFCFFAEDTGIFPRLNCFTELIGNYSKADGSDLHSLLQMLFDKLNSRQSLPQEPTYLAEFPYVNGGLFASQIPLPHFSRRARQILLDCGQLNWDEINPDIFGSMIQAVADPSERGNLGMHYTSVPNIKKLIGPLFLDQLYAIYEQQADDAKALDRLLQRIEQMRFFDPACGSGNFLIIIYKELRLLEVQILQRIIELHEAEGNTGKQLVYTSGIKLSQFYGIEIKDFAHEIAILSLWLAEHQMNKYFEERLMGFAECRPLLPLGESGKIVKGNAATVDWLGVCPPSAGGECYLVGNPPYIGSRMQGAEQKADLERCFGKDYKNLDYISLWFYKGAAYLRAVGRSSLAFVSTNSVCQGQHVPLLWPRVLGQDLEIGFAHSSFKWSNNAKGQAGVTVAIVGLRRKSTQPKYLYSEGLQQQVKNINAYLIDAADVYVESRTKPLSDFPRMFAGNMPNDGGALRFNQQIKIRYEQETPGISKYIRSLMGGSDFLNSHPSYCFWIDDKDLNDAITYPQIANAIQRCRTHRLESVDPGTNKLAERSHQFRDRTLPQVDSLIIPATSSERRDYIPIGILDSSVIISKAAMAVYDAEPWLFAVLHSRMHMIWVDAVGGKLETRYRYSAQVCYNTFPLPALSKAQKFTLTEHTRAVLHAREAYAGKTMAWLYNPDTMPTKLLEAHRLLDASVERLYSTAPLRNDAARLSQLIRLYQQMQR